MPERQMFSVLLSNSQQASPSRNFDPSRYAQWTIAGAGRCNLLTRTPFAGARVRADVVPPSLDSLGENDDVIEVERSAMHGARIDRHRPELHPVRRPIAHAQMS